jgi:cytochrome c biogenesis protein CcmG/thiol:disulfide interchange protein DsbE
MKKKLFFSIPILLFILLALVLGFGLNLKPREIPSALIGKPAPNFSLPALYNDELTFSTSDIKTGNNILVNVFASWCGPCIQEHPLLMELAEKENIIIFGINQKDSKVNAKRWLIKYGNPYKKIGSDFSGRASIEWGIYGVPETFVLDGNGCIQYKHISPLTNKIIKDEILPRLNGKKHKSC